MKTKPRIHLFAIIAILSTMTSTCFGQTASGSMHTKLQNYAVSSGKFIAADLPYNGGFEADNQQSITPSGWTVSGADTTASHTASVGGAHTGMYYLANWASSAYTVDTYQTITGLRNGTYILTAWVKGSGDQEAAFMEATDFGGPSLRANIGALANWTEISIPNIVVANGRCTIDFYSNAAANQWFNIDDVALTSRG